MHDDSSYVPTTVLPIDGDPPDPNAGGDNLSYTVELKLRTNPNVTDNPLNMNNLINNQQVSGAEYVNLVISSPVSYSTTFSLVVDGVVSPDTFVEKNGD